MELTHLRYFIAVAEELHFSRAAARLHIAQPALSQQIKRLEDELEVKLFTRSSRRVELTEAGIEFLREANEIIERAENSAAAMRQYASGTRGSLKLGFNEPAICTFLPYAIKKFIELYPDVDIALHELETVEQIKALESKRIHLGIMRPFGCDLSGFHSQLLLKTNYVLAIPKGHRLNKTSKVSLSSLKNEAFIMFPHSVNPSLYEAIQKSCRDAGFVPDIVQDVVSKQTTLALVEAGIGIALVPEFSRHLASDGVIFRQIESKLPDIEIFAVWQETAGMRPISNFLQITDVVAMKF